MRHGTQTIVIATSEQAQAMLDHLDGCHKTAQANNYAKERAKPIKSLGCTCCGDEHLRVWLAEDEHGNELAIPPALETEPPSLESVLCACERMMVGITRKSTTHCEWYEGIEHDGADEAAAIIAKGSWATKC